MSLMVSPHLTSSSLDLISSELSACAVIGAAAAMFYAIICC